MLLGLSERGGESEEMRAERVGDSGGVFRLVDQGGFYSK